MKKTLILFPVFLLVTIFANAQTSAGNQTLGLNLSIISQKADITLQNLSDNSFSAYTSKYTTFTIGPNYSYFISNKLDAGVGGDFSYSKTTNLQGGSYDVGNQNDHSWNVMFFARKYFLYNNVIGVRTGPYVAFGRDNAFVQQGAGSNTVTKTFNAGLKLELVYFPSKKIGFSAILANLDYKHYSERTGIADNITSNALNFGFVNSGVSMSVFYDFQ